MISIIIPTLNEENCLPFLLESIKNQDFGVKKTGSAEIIVADNSSKDKTVEIARDYGCKVTPGGFPSKGKNEGAKFSRGDLILFLDADTVLTEGALSEFLKEFKERNLDIASFFLGSFHWFHNLSYKIFYNSPAKISEKFLPQAMNAILVRKELHQKIGGFDEEIKIGEELDYVRRGSKIGEFGVLKSAKILASPRRFEKDGWLKTWLKYFLCQVHMLILGPVKSDVLKYRFGHYKNSKNMLK